LKKTLAAVAAAVAALSGCASHDANTKATEVSQAAVAAPAAAAPRNCVPPPNDLVVKDLTPGTGDTLRFRTAVLMNYTGWLYDPCAPDQKGAVFDTSEGRQPISFMVGVGRVIRGWDEGVVGMKEGGKRLLVIPPDKGYGANAAPGGKIPPNSTLVFEVEAVKVIMQAQ
jgi:FKBP-type peptidyl-prolyl cis-trans isomerase FkpA